jgi:hypothetical protein
MDVPGDVNYQSHMSAEDAAGLYELNDPDESRRCAESH